MVPQKPLYLTKYHLFLCQLRVISNFFFHTKEVSDHFIVSAVTV